MLYCVRGAGGGGLRVDRSKETSLTTPRLSPVIVHGFSDDVNFLYVNLYIFFICVVNILYSFKCIYVEWKFFLYMLNTCFVSFFERSVKVDYIKVDYCKVDLILCLLSVNNFAPCALKNSIQKIHFMKRNRKKL